MSTVKLLIYILYSVQFVLTLFYRYVRFFPQFTVLILGHMFPLAISPGIYCPIRLLCQRNCQLIASNMEKQCVIYAGVDVTITLSNVNLQIYFTKI